MSWMILYKKQLFDLQVKVPWRLLWYVTHRLMVMHLHTKYHWPISRQKCYGPDKKILFKKTIIWSWDQRSRSHEGHYGMQHTVLWSCTYKLSSNEQVCCIYLNYLTLRSKVKVPRRSLWYAIYRLMIMHPHTNYHWSTSKDKNVMAWTRKYCENQQGGRDVIFICVLWWILRHINFVMFAYAGLCMRNYSCLYHLYKIWQYLIVSFLYLSDSNALFFYWVMCSEKIDCFTFY